MVTDLFKKLPVEVPNRSGFDMSHENLFTTKCGTLTPCFVHEVNPNDTVSIGLSAQVQLPPMATDFYGRVRAIWEFFFVPYRILYGGWQDFITHYDPSSFPPGSPSSQVVYPTLPPLSIVNSNLGVSSLADYLGLKPVGASSARTQIPNPFRFMAYHKIYSDWYRDSRLQVDPFDKGYLSDSVRSMPFRTYSTSIVLDTTSELQFADGTSVFSLRQRNFERDYFTNATTRPQAGSGSSLSFATVTDASSASPTAAGTGSFSIASLRAANALQKWLETNNIAGTRYGDQIKAQFGVYPSDAILDRSIYLGRQVLDVYNRSVFQTAADGSTTQSPFDSVGAKFGSSMAVGNGSIVPSFTSNEHGIVMGIFSLVPSAVYDCGTARQFNMARPGDFPFPLLASVGDQAIGVGEVASTQVSSPAGYVFGYTQRYSEHKFMLDEVHGLLRDGQSLDSFSLKRSAVFDLSTTPATVPTLGSSFIEIPSDFLDQVLAVSGSNSGFDCWVDSYFETKKVSCLPAYSIPTLGDIKNTHTEVVPNGGVRL